MNYKEIILAISKYIPSPVSIELTRWVDELRKENDALRDEIIILKGRITELEAPSYTSSPTAPTCPNCSTVGRPVFMSPIPVDFIPIEKATHECTKCGFKIPIK